MISQDVKDNYDEIADRLKSGIKRYIPEFVYKLPMYEKEDYYLKAYEDYEKDYNLYYDVRLKEVFQSIEDELTSFFVIDQFLYILQTKFTQWESSEWILENFKWELKPDPLADRGISNYVFWLILYDRRIHRPERKREFKISIDYDVKIKIQEYND